MNTDDTYKTPFSLHYNDNAAHFTGGALCISCLELNDLKSIQKNFLHPKERSYFNKLQHSKRQRSYLLGRYCAKQALLTCTTLQHSADVLIEKGVFEQPVIYHPDLNNIQVSITHTEALGAALAFPEAYPMAIDIEAIEMNNNDVIMTQLTTYEKKLANMFSNLPLQSLWTMKEALSKVVKCGLTVPFEFLEIESIKQCRNFSMAHFKNFSQYQAVSFSLGKNACSIVYPKNTYIDIDIWPIQIRFSKF